MIVQWKWNSLEQATAVFMGKQLELKLEQGKWRHYVDGRRVRNTWASAKLAMRKLEEHHERLIQRLIAEHKQDAVPAVMVAQPRVLVTANRKCHTARAMDAVGA